jgi:exonuclease III
MKKVYHQLLIIFCIILFVVGTSIAVEPKLSQYKTEMNGAVELKVMTFNIWVGGTKVDFDAVVDAIKKADADIIGIQESKGNLLRLATALNYNYYPGLQILSRYPIAVPSEAPAQYVYVLLEDNLCIVVSNVHLYHKPYGPYDLRDGMDLNTVLANEQGHINEITPKLVALQELIEKDIPVFLTGDFNVPSHLDWTNDVAAASTEEFRKEANWPVSIALEEAGFRDTYREIFPNPLTHPAPTWTPGYPAGFTEQNEVHDRIDFIYAAGQSTTIMSQIIGEDGPYTDIVVTPWPSDHRAVVSTFNVTPAILPDDARIFPQEPPCIKVEKNVYVRNESITVSFSNSSGHAKSWIGIYPKGMKPGVSGGSYRWKYIDGAISGEIVLHNNAPGTTWPLPLGEYEAHLFADGGYTILATTTFVME